MPTDYTTYLGLPWPEFRDRDYHIPQTEAIAMIDRSMLRQLRVKVSAPGLIVPLPSTNLLVDIAAGEFVASDSSVVTYAGVTGHAVPDAATTYLWLTDAGALASGTGWPAVTSIVKLAKVTAAGGVITALEDSRVAWRSAGGVAGTSPYLIKAGDTIPDGAVFVAGTAAGAGVQFGTASNQKMGWWGATPAARPGNTTDLKAGLVTLGLVSGGGATPLDLGGGKITSGQWEHSGDGILADGVDIQVGTSTGTMIGTGPLQKLAFFGEPPVIQPGASSEIVSQVLIPLGLMADGGVPSLNLVGGALSCGSFTATGGMTAQSFLTPWTTVSGAVTITGGGAIRINATGGACFLTLGSPVDGELYEIVRADATGNNATIQTTGGPLIYGPGPADVASSILLNGANKYVRLRYSATTVGFHHLGGN